MKNKDINVFITARTNSSRLPKKCLLSFGSSTVIEHVIDRSKNSGFKTFLCTTIEKSDNILEDIAIKKGIKLYRGSVQNKMLRWLQCAKKFNLDFFHTIDADDPFFCPEEVTRSYNALISSSNFDIIKPSHSSSRGGATVGYTIRTSSLNKALKYVAEDSDTEMISGVLDTNKDLCQLELSEPSKYIITNRLTLDYWEDYIFLSAIKCMLRNKSESRKEIFNILSDIKILSKINSFRTEQWAKKQSETTIYRKTNYD